jgi:hypothetical protein
MGEEVQGIKEAFARFVCCLLRSRRVVAGIEVAQVGDRIDLNSGKVKAE